MSITKQGHHKFTVEEEDQRTARSLGPQSRNFPKTFS